MRASEQSQADIESGEQSPADIESGEQSQADIESGAPRLYIRVRQAQEKRGLLVGLGANSSTLVTDWLKLPKEVGGRLGSLRRSLIGRHC